MPRQRRLLIDNACYHIFSRGNNRSAVFRHEQDRQTYLRALLNMRDEYVLDIYHYCLMTNHVHLVVRSGSGQALRKALQRLNLIYAYHVRNTYDHVGHVWQDRFKSLLIADDRYLLACGRYVEMNPVSAHVVTRPELYPWSSYRVYALGEYNPLVTRSPTYLGLGPTAQQRQAAYRRFAVHDEDILPANWLDYYVLGASDSSALGEGSVPIMPRPRGRPRKK